MEIRESFKMHQASVGYLSAAAERIAVEINHLEIVESLEMC